MNKDKFRYYKERATVLKGSTNKPAIAILASKNKPSLFDKQKLKTELSGFKCSSCNLEFASNSKAPACMNCGSKKVTASSVVIAKLPSQDECGSAQCGSCGTHLVVRKEVASSIGKKLSSHCPECASEVEFQETSDESFDMVKDTDISEVENVDSADEFPEGDLTEETVEDEDSEEDLLSEEVDETPTDSADEALEDESESEEDLEGESEENEEPDDEQASLGRNPKKRSKMLLGAQRRRLVEKASPSTIKRILKLRSAPESASTPSLVKRALGMRKTSESASANLLRNVETATGIRRVLKLATKAPEVAATTSKSKRSLEKLMASKPTESASFFRTKKRYTEISEMLEDLDNVDEVDAEILEQEHEEICSSIKVPLARVLSGNSLEFVRKTDGVIVAFMDNMPVATLEKAKALEADVGIFENSSFFRALQLEASSNGIEQALKNHKFSPISVEIPQSKVLAKFINKKVEAKQAEFISKQREVETAMLQSLSIAAAGMRKGFFSNHKNPLVETLASSLTSVGVENATNFVNNALAASSDQYHKTLLTVASELASQPTEVRNALAEKVAATEHSTASSTNVEKASIESRLSRIGIPSGPVVPYTPKSVNQQKEVASAKWSSMKDRISSFRNSSGSLF